MAFVAPLSAKPFRLAPSPKICVSWAVGLKAGPFHWTIIFPVERLSARWEITTPVECALIIESGGNNQSKENARLEMVVD